jgi:hypothetical protein
MGWTAAPRQPVPRSIVRVTQVRVGPWAALVLPQMLPTFFCSGWLCCRCHLEWGLHLLLFHTAAVVTWAERHLGHWRAQYWNLCTEFGIMRWVSSATLVKQNTSLQFPACPDLHFLPIIFLSHFALNQVCTSVKDTISRKPLNWRLKSFLLVASSSPEACILPPSPHVEFRWLLFYPWTKFLPFWACDWCPPQSLCQPTNLLVTSPIMYLSLNDNQKSKFLVWPMFIVGLFTVANLENCSKCL